MNRVLIIVLLALVIVAMRVTGATAATPNDPVVLDRATHLFQGSYTPGGSAGILGVGNCSGIDGDAAFHLKQCYVNHHGPSDGVGNMHGVFSGIIGTWTDQPYNGQMVSIAGGSYVTAGTTQNITGIVGGVMAEVEIQPRAAPIDVFWANPIRADARLYDATLERYWGIWSRAPQGNAVIGELALFVADRLPPGGIGYLAKSDIVIRDAYLQLDWVDNAPQPSDCSVGTLGRMVGATQGEQYGLYLCTPIGWRWVTTE